MSTSPIKSSPGFIRPLGLALALALGLLSACGDRNPKAASQVAVRVNNDEISVHQVNFVLQQQDTPQESLDAASRQVLNRLVDQELALQKALELKIDRQPAVLQALEAARREVLARAYVERIGEAVLKPTAAEIEQFYKDKPALFSERRIYQLQELNIEAKPEQLPEITKKLAAAKDLGEFAEYLKSQNLRFAQNRAVRAAEQLPMEQLKEFATMRDGQARLVATPTGAAVIMLVKSQSQPVSLEKAQPAIEQYLLTQRRREVVENDIKDLRAAAKIEYVGKFAEPAASAVATSLRNGSGEPATPGAPAPVSESSPIVSGSGVNK
ncbi:EpsD family peptidyl-prolyl cis-trans isomerase [Azohydromonas aeria]|uniref:EpsD family peptidyl-prolyl cis-trans isomerase n=1 Tax=Azohydromonas aeria TaxID=2590212 RepID=UPI0012FA208B|nr:EpsD family peptidyl-prolyl cis-trans isomerase [Azohydromonas aeria]